MRILMRLSIVAVVALGAVAGAAGLHTGPNAGPLGLSIAPNFALAGSTCPGGGGVVGVDPLILPYEHNVTFGTAFFPVSDLQPNVLPNATLVTNAGSIPGVYAIAFQYQGVGHCIKELNSLSVANNGNFSVLAFGGNDTLFQPGFTTPLANVNCGFTESFPELTFQSTVDSLVPPCPTFNSDSNT